MGKNIILLLGTLFLSHVAVAGVFQCADGTFSDRPCADPGGKSINLNAAPRAPDQFDGLGEVQTVQAGAGPVNVIEPEKVCNRVDYQTKAAIDQGIKDWSITRCMSMDQVLRVTRRQNHTEYSHTNGSGQSVVEWVFDGSPAKRVTFIDGLVTSIH